MAAIVKKMGWENGVVTPNGKERFDEAAFVESVDRIIVKVETVEIVFAGSKEAIIKASA